MIPETALYPHTRVPGASELLFLLGLLSVLSGPRSSPGPGKSLAPGMADLLAGSQAGLARHSCLLCPGVQGDAAAQGLPTAQLLEWRGNQVPPSVKRALDAPWRGQNCLGGKKALKALEFFDDEPVLTNPMDVMCTRASPTKPSCKLNVKTKLRLKAEGTAATAHEVASTRSTRR